MFNKRLREQIVHLCSVPARPALAAFVALAAFAGLLLLLSPGPAPVTAAPVEEPQTAAGSPALVVIAATMAPTATTTTILQHTPDPSFVGEPIWVEFQVVPNPSNGQSVDGTIRVTDGVVDCSRTVDSLTSGWPYPGGWRWDCNLYPTTAGVKTLTATFTPSDPLLFLPSTSAGVSHQVNTTTAVIIAISASPGSPVYGQEVEFTATIDPSVCTGVVFFDDGGTEIGRAVLDGGTATEKTFNLGAGPHRVQAVYMGSDDCAEAESGVLPLTVNKATPTVSVTGPGSSYYAESSVTFTATVTSGAGTPTGKVVFSGWGDDYEATLSDGKASFTITELHDVGNFDITATYGGDDNFNGSGGTKNHTVNQANTKTELTSPLDESDYGQEVRFTASVSADPQGAAMPTGNVTFYYTGTTEISGCENVSLGSPATCATSDLPVGTHEITATYKGDTNFNISTSVVITHTVNKTDSETSLESSANPSDYGQTVTFTATVEAAGMGSGTPTGTVTFTLGTVGVMTGTLDGSGVTSVTTDTLPAGSHDITAEYGGDSSFEPSDDSWRQTVNRPATTTTLTSSSPTNTSVVSETVTFTATVTASTTPTGTVEFKDFTTVLATKTLDGSGQATFATSSLPAGRHVLKAEYKGTPNISPSSSERLYHTVGAAGTTTTLASSPSSPTVFGQTVTFTATVTAGGTPVTSGQVTFKDGATTLGSDTLDGSGQATLSTSALAVGTHPITAVYGGDADFAGSTSAQVDHVVNQGSTTTTIDSVNPISPTVVGQPVLVSFTVVASGAGSGTPTGDVTVDDGTGASCTGSVASAGSCTLTPTTADLKTLTATYAGDDNFSGSPDTEPHQVDPASTTTTVTSSPNPSVEGQNVTITANVTANSPSTATPDGGNVQFNFDDGSPIASVSLVSGSAITDHIFTSAGSFTITATYLGDGTNFNPSPSGTTTHNVSTTPADLSVTKSDSPDPVNAGANLTYVINVTNNEAELVSVTLVDTLPSEVSFVSATPPCTHLGGVVTCDLGDLAASGGSATVTIVVNVPIATPAGTVLSNTAQVNGAQSDTEETTVYRLPQLGDCNGDDAVNLADVWAIVRDIFDPTFQGTTGCDANKDRQVDAGDVPSTVLIMLRRLNAAPEPAPSTSSGPVLSSTEGPALAMPDQVSAAPGGLATVPVTFDANGHSITSLAFSVDYDETWLALDPTDRDGNGIPDAVIFSLPGEFSYLVTFDGDDADGEVDIFIGDISPPLTSLSDGPIAFMILNVGSSPGRTQGAVRFSLDPMASFGDTSGQSVPGTATPGGEHRIYLPVLSR